MNVTRKYARSVYDALMLCYEMWDEMAGMESAKGKGGRFDKHETTVYKRTGIPCAACSHSSNRGYVDGDACRRCIMLELWPKACTRGESPFRSWWNNKGTSSDARKIAKFALTKAQRIAKKWGFE